MIQNLITKLEKIKKNINIAAETEGMSNILTDQKIEIKAIIDCLKRRDIDKLSCLIEEGFEYFQYEALKALKAIEEEV